jgi:hypothetical protein
LYLADISVRDNYRFHAYDRPAPEKLKKKCHSVVDASAKQEKEAPPWFPMLPVLLWRSIPVHQMSREEPAWT